MHRVLTFFLCAATLAACDDDSTSGVTPLDVDAHTGRDAGPDDASRADRFVSPPKADGGPDDMGPEPDADPVVPDFDAAVREDATIEDPDAFILPDGFQETLPTALLEVYLLDIWAQPLPRDGTSLTVRFEGQVHESNGFPIALSPLDEAGDYSITVAADHHEPAELRFRYDGTEDLDGVAALLQAADNRRGFSVSHSWREIDGTQLPVHTIYVGLRHDWFSAQARPARRGNDAELLLDGEAAWGSVFEALQTAQEKVLVSTWWWESTFEMVRDPDRHHLQSEAERRRFTAIQALEDTGVPVRVAVGQFLWMDGVVSNLATDAPLRAKGEAANDNFEYMGQANPAQGQFFFEVEPFLFGERVLRTRPETRERTFDAELEIVSTVPSRPVDLTEFPFDLELPYGSIHQKFAVVDSETAFIGGMNLRRVDWDTSAHHVFEPRRMLFDASAEHRQEVLEKERLPDTGPRKDYMIRLDGPVAQDAADLFRRRWRWLLDNNARYSQNASDFEINRDIAPRRGGVQAQVTATMPDPLPEHAIAETWFNAVNRAEDYIFIEDQYWRIPMLVDAIIARMERRPNLKLVVVTKPVDEFADPGCWWTHITHNDLLERFPGRYMTLQLRAFDTAVSFGFDETDAYLPNMDTHSKVFMVDDVFISIGSANKNNRGIVYEAELNVAIFDGAWVADARRQILNAILPPDIAAAENPDDWYAQLEEAASWNDFVYENWSDEDFDLDLDGDPLPARYAPRGFIYGLDFRAPEECLIENVGPDMS